MFLGQYLPLIRFWEGNSIHQGVSWSRLLLLLPARVIIFNCIHPTIQVFFWPASSSSSFRDFPAHIIWYRYAKHGQNIVVSFFNYVSLSGLVPIRVLLMDSFLIPSTLRSERILLSKSCLLLCRPTVGLTALTLLYPFTRSLQLQTPAVELTGVKCDLCGQLELEVAVWRTECVLEPVTLRVVSSGRPSSSSPVLHTLPVSYEYSLCQK